MGKLFISEHPLIQNKIALLRCKDTSTKEFKELVGEVALLLTYEATRDLPLVEKEVETPLAVAKCHVVEEPITIVPILRAGIGMADGMPRLLPAAKGGLFGLYRDPETLMPVEYYCKLPSDIAQSRVLLVDPMLATGGTAEAAISFLKERGAKDISLLCILAAPDGVKLVQQSHPDVDIYTAAYDEKLNEEGYIVPGLGDAGDRVFGTK